ncbi:MAG: discoidin domain-containing protein [Pseudomonadota bacterium]
MTLPRALLLLVLVPAAAWAGATASNFKPEHRKGANYWNAQSAIDGDPATCWMVPGESPNRGEWLELDIPKGKLDKIGMTVGWAQDAETFKDYARVKTVKIEAFSLNDRQELSPRGSTTATFQDTADWQVIDVENLQVGEDLFGGKVRISIVDIYDGQDFPNLAISELKMYLEEFDTTLKAPEFGDAASAAAGDTGPEAMLDTNEKTIFTTAAQGAFFSVEAPGFGVSSIGIKPGPATFARPKTVEVTANNLTETFTLQDDPKLAVQWVQVPTITGYSGGAFGEIVVKITDTYPGSQGTDIAIAELYGKATNFEGF